jgi:hypothetical protein
MNEEIPIAIVKCKVGPLTARYQNGEYQEVDREKNGAKRKAVLGLDNSHSKDYKVAYASDPLIVVHAEDHGTTHDQLRQKLKLKDLWLQSFQPIDVPHGNGWYAGFQSTPRDQNRLDRLKSQLETVKIDEAPMREGENHANAWV